MQRSRSVLPELIGCFAIFTSALCFYLATVFIRAGRVGFVIDPKLYVVVRFLFGFVVFGLLLIGKRKQPRVKEVKWLSLRIVTNVLAVFLFFEAVDRTSAAEANILNLTYPVFIAIFSYFFFQHKGDLLILLVGPIAFIGIIAVVGGDGLLFGWDSLYGLGSGVTAASSIIFLNLTRLKNDTDVILFYLFGIGSLLSLLCFFPFLTGGISEGMLPFLFGSAAVGVLGQLCLTYGFGFVTAFEGSILSSTRILLAALLGPMLAGDAPLSGIAWGGALLIFGCNAYIAYRKWRQSITVAL